jgi:hypothetical protein
LLDVVFETIVEESRSAQAAGTNSAFFNAEGFKLSDLVGY